jgi:integrase/recombinase XerD
VAGSRRRRALDTKHFEEALEALLAELRVRWYSKPLQKQARIVLLRFFDQLRQQGVSDLRLVREEHVTAYARSLQEPREPGAKPYALATQRSYLALVQRLFRFLLREGVLLRDPTVDLVLPSWKKLPRALLNQAQSRRLVASPNPFTVRGKRDRAVLELLYGTAIRVGECERLDLRDVDLLRGQLFVRLGKGRKDRVVPLLGRAAEALDVYLRDARAELAHNPREQALFLTTRGTPLAVKRIQDLVRSHARAAGIKVRVTPYTLRHGCATHLLQNGADVRHVQKLLGHAQVQTTAIYTHVAPEDLRRAVEKAHPRERAYNRRRKKDASCQGQGK